MHDVNPFLKLREMPAISPYQKNAEPCSSVKKNPFKEKRDGETPYFCLLKSAESLNPET
jgi:hypothetical protein